MFKWNLNNINNAVIASPSHLYITYLQHCQAIDLCTCHFLIIVNFSMKLKHIFNNIIL